MVSPEELLRLIELHLDRSGETARSFGMRVLGDPNFIPDLRDGREPRRATVGRVLAAIEPAQADTEAA